MPLLNEELADELETTTEAFAEEPQHDGAEHPYEGVEANTGQSWLSNEVIIGSLPQAKLLGALQYHKSMVTLCQTELSLRSLGSRPTSRFYGDYDRRLEERQRNYDRHNNNGVERPRRIKRNAAKVVADAVKALGLGAVKDFLELKLKQEKKT